MSEQPEALRLADALESDFDPDWMYELGYDQIAAELRRLHEVEVSAQDRIDRIYAMYEAVSKQNDALMDQQRAQIAAMRGKIQ